MDFLKAEIQSKKRQLEHLSPSPSPGLSTSTATHDDSPPPKKYLKRSELEALRAHEEQERAQEKERLRKERLYGTKPQSPNAAAAVPDRLLSPGAAAQSSRGTSADLSAGEDKKAEMFNVSNDEAIRRLRKIGQPIRLFAETDKERRLRLRALELIEERSEGQRNDFARAMEGQELGIEREKEKKKAADTQPAKDKAKLDATAKSEAQSRSVEADGKPKVPNPKDEEVLVDLDLVKSNPHKVYPQIYHALKRVLKEWEQSLADRPESVKLSTQGKVAAATQSTSAEYLKPLFKQLRKRDLADDVLLAVAEITFYMQTREYLRANDAYLRLSIGNAPWPIGVTMVGIHERAGRERIFSNNVAHALNDETSRKYIQSLKRLLTFAQAIRPPADVSQKMG
ncbi:mRNA splicing protein PRP18 [Sporobolomyces koalae]|uniref:mRNA splicing protein PRP18 n=1 Tax=Sporobolomyces koalae TaxID=500713 RepID=UPI0031737CE7